MNSSSLASVEFQMLTPHTVGQYTTFLQSILKELRPREGTSYSGSLEFGVSSLPGTVPLIVICGSGLMQKQVHHFQELHYLYASTLAFDTIQIQYFTCL